MKSLHLTILIFCQIILASFILYSQYTLASPLVEQPKPSHQQQQQQIEQSKHVDEISYRNQQKSPESLKLVEPVVAKKNDFKPLGENSAPQVIEHVVPSQYVSKEVPVEQPKQQVQVVAAAPAVPSTKVSDDSKVVPVVGSVSKVVDSSIVKSPPVVEEVKQIVQVKGDLVNIKQQEPRLVAEVAAPVVPSVPVSQTAPVVPIAPFNVPNEKVVRPSEAVPLLVPEPQKLVLKSAEHEMSEKKALVPVQPAQIAAEKQPVVSTFEKSVASAEPAARVEERKLVDQAVPRAPVIPSVVTKGDEVLPIKSEQPVEPIREVVVPQKSNSLLPVKGGLGPLHLLASSLCSYQPERLVADENLNLLYKERAAIRKSLFDFMSLKFTNLEKLSSRLNPGYASLEVVPPKKAVDQTSTKEGVVPSHGWPVVGVCTAHDLKLMAEAAWCDSTATPQSTVHQSSEHSVDKQQQPQQQVVASNAQTQTRAQSNRSIKQQNEEQQQAASNDQHSAVISKMLHVNDVKDAPVIENSLAGLNLTQQQLVSIQAQATSTRECRRNALRLTKALFNHLAEDQKNESESWPKLYSHLADDECARKRMIDIVTALAGFRGESTSIRRDNVEYAFAMDDLRTKVLESEVNVPLTFDKQFIEIEQFLQQSVKLMLANIDPGRARLTSMRYRSLMPGPVSADDQCIELHQRLLAKNYPTDCNPTQFGQLPDVLRMAASSLALWSIETELNKYSSRVVHEYPPSGSSVVSQSQVKQDVHECIANLVSA